MGFVGDGQILGSSGKRICLGRRVMKTLEKGARKETYPRGGQIFPGVLMGGELA